MFLFFLFFLSLFFLNVFVLTWFAVLQFIYFYLFLKNIVVEVRKSWMEIINTEGDVEANSVSNDAMEVEY